MRDRPSETDEGRREQTRDLWASFCSLLEVCRSLKNRYEEPMMRSHLSRIRGDAGARSDDCVHLGTSVEVSALRLCLTSRLPVFSSRSLVLQRSTELKRTLGKAQRPPRTRPPVALGLACNKHLLGLAVNGGHWAPGQNNPCK